MSSPISHLAERYGIATEYTGLDGASHIVPEDTIRAILVAMGVDPDIAGLDEAPFTRQAALGGSLPRCYLPDWLKDGRAWGIALQLYALRSERNWGIGDFRDLADFARFAAAAGADFVGCNPLHALFLSDPGRRSPFFPSNRRFLNPLYITVETVPGYAALAAETETVTALRAAGLVDYAGVSSLKLSALRRIFPQWHNAEDAGPDYARPAFENFRREGGESLELHCLHDAMALHMAAEGQGALWTAWPEDCRSPWASGSRAFAEANQEAIDFMAWLQWLAAVQLRQAQQSALDAGMRIGLYLDFAVGEAPDGSAAWSDPMMTMRGVEVGAPPDYFSTTGQNWGLAPLSPATLVAQDLAPYAALVGASTRYAGALRIDHAMGIQQMFLVPQGQPASTGTYIHYPLERMVETLATISHQHRAVMIGEDLGNVPVGFRDVMEEAAILSYRILYFEQYGGRFFSPDEYPRNALACVATHDLPTLEGWWRGEDVELRRQHGLIGDEAAGAQFEQRAGERHHLLEVLTASGALSHDDWETAWQAAYRADALPAGLTEGIHRFLARTPSRLLAVRLEDLLGERLPVNLPGTINEYPNWQRKLGAELQSFANDPRFAATTAMLRQERPRRD